MITQVLIGREDGSNNLLCHDGQKPLRLVNDNSVPDSVSRLLHKSADRRGHCRLTIDPEKYSVKIENVNPANSTLVDGAVISGPTDLRADSVVELGGHRFRLDLTKVYRQFGARFPRAKATAASNDGPAYCTDHLREIYRQYTRESKQIQDRLRRIGTIRSISGIASPLAMILFVANEMYQLHIPSVVRLLLLGGGVTGILLSAILSMRDKNHLATAKDKLDKKYKPLYVCPNPDCDHIFALSDYDNTIHNFKQCPSCKCRYVKNFSAGDR